MNKKVVAIIQVHMSSSRLPGKVLKDLAGAPALYRFLERMSHSKHLTEIVIATSVKPCDDIIVEKCKEWGYPYFRGSDTDVLSRFWGTAQAHPADIYVRVTSDNPLVDPGCLDVCIEYLVDHNCRYTHTDSTVPNGLDCEVFTAELMEECAKNSTEPYEHEHVTPYMYLKQDSIGVVSWNKDYSNFRLTLDTEEDYQVISNVYNALYTPGNTFDKDDMIEYLEQHPEIVAINSSIHQKTCFETRDDLD